MLDLDFSWLSLLLNTYIQLYICCPVPVKLPIPIFGLFCLLFKNDHIEAHKDDIKNVSSLSYKSNCKLLMLMVVI